MDIKVEGLNGQLPNLDLFTLVNKICLKEDLYTTFKNRGTLNPRANVYKHWKYSLTTMLHMIMTQSTGIPNGNHGLFLRYGIQAVTMNGFQRSHSPGNQIGFYSLGKILEGIFRSLNNLLERFHQSYFFYLLPSNDRFLSIIYFIPILGALVGALLVKSLVNWYKIVEKPITKFKSSEKDKIYFVESKDDLENVSVHSDFVKVCLVYILSHIFGIVLMNSAVILSKYGAQYGYTTDFAVFYGFTAILVLSTLLPLFLRLSSYKSIVALNMFILWEIGLAILGIGMINICLGIVCGFIYVPLTLLVSVSSCKVRSNINYFIWLLAQPMIILVTTVMIYTWFMFPNTPFKELLQRGLSASKQALVFGIVDSEIYGNWIYNVACCVFIPSWINMCCCVMSCPYSKEENENKQKTE